MATLNDKILAYLLFNNIAFNSGDYQTGQPEGEADQLLHWDTKLGLKPNQEQLDAAWSAKVSADNAVAYKAKRADEYPSIYNYIDGVVKGDQMQIQTYIDSCLAVKAKYPKPTM